DAAGQAPAGRVREGAAAGVSRRSRQLHPPLAELAALRAIDRRRAVEGLHPQDRRGVPEAEPAAAVLLSRAAGERFQRSGERTADALGLRQGDVAADSGYGEALRAPRPSAGGLPGPPTRRPR